MSSSASAERRRPDRSEKPVPPRRTRGPALLRVLLPALLVVAWLAVAGVGGPYFGKISEVSTDDRSSFLPKSAESTRVAELQGAFRDTDAVPALILLVREGGLLDEDRAWAREFRTSVQEAGLSAGETSPPLPSEDGEALRIVVPLPDGEVVDDVRALTTRLEDGAPEGLETYVTGPAGFTADLVAGFAGIDGLLLGVALAVVFVILLVVYRSPVLPVLVLLTSVLALSAAILVVYWLAATGLVTVNGQVQGILFILVVGAATDYSLLYTSRYRDALLHHRRRGDATRAALEGAVEPVLASGATVIAGLLCLLLSDLASNQALGPVAAVGILLSVLAALTFQPAVLWAVGRRAFWPFRPRYDPSREERVRVVDRRDGDRPSVEGRGLWPSVARFVARRPRIVWVVTTAVLLVPAGFSTQFEASGVEQSELVLGESPARAGQEALAGHFPGGSGSPAVVLVPTTALDAAVSAVQQTGGVAAVAAVAEGSPSGTLPLGDDAVSGAGPFAGVQPTAAQGRYQLQVTLADAADSAAAQDTVRALREESLAHGTRAGVLRGLALTGGVITSAGIVLAATFAALAVIPIMFLVQLAFLVAFGVLLDALVVRSLLVPALAYDLGRAVWWPFARRMGP